MIKETGEFVINLPSTDLTYALDKAGCTTGAKIDKFKELNLTPAKSFKIDTPSISEAPVCLECKVTQVLELGSHDMFLAEVVSVSVDEKYLDEKGVFHMDQCDLVAYEHGAYRKMSDIIGTFGYSVRKKA
jgi:flavin reductase (DIM6/NTAB) family NADH-FMN oxidoreductase RutF